MSSYTYEEIVKQAKSIKNNVEKSYKLGENAQWGYFIAKAILTPNKSVEKWYIKPATAPTGDNLSIKILKKDYMDMAKRFVKYADTNKILPNYISCNNKKVKVNDYVYMFARILVYYYNNKVYPNYANVDSSSFTKKVTKVSTVSNNCSNPYKSTPHYTERGCNKLGQCTAYFCGPHCIHQSLKKFGITNISESTLASWAGTTTAGTGHSGLDTAIAKASKQSGVKLTVQWKNFSDFGKTNAERFKEIGKILCNSNKAVFFHIGYQCSGSCSSGTVFGHYEMLDKIDISSSTVRVLNSLGSKCGSGYCGHLQNRSFSLQAHYIGNISQKSVCIITKG